MVKLNKKTGESGANIESSIGAIGERLKAARENKGLSLEDVHNATKIHPRTIEALEKGRLEDNIGETYVKAFLKNYAAYLGMDAKNIIAEYVSKKHNTEKQITETKKADAPKKEPAVKKNAYPKRDYSELIRAMTTVLVFIAAFSALMFGIVNAARYAKSVVAEIKTRNAASKKAGPAKEAVKASKDAGLTQAAVNEIVPIPKQDKLTLAITTSTDVWLKVMLDGKVAFHKTLSKKSKETWKAEKEIRLAEIGKPESLKLNVNGKDIDFSKNRLSRSILITQEGVDFEPK